MALRDERQTILEAPLPEHLALALSLSLSLSLFLTATIKKDIGLDNVFMIYFDPLTQYR